MARVSIIAIAAAIALLSCTGSSDTGASPTVVQGIPTATATATLTAPTAKPVSTEPASPTATATIPTPTPKPAVATPTTAPAPTQPPPPTATPIPTEPAVACIDSGDHASIQDALKDEGDVAVLCPNSTFLLKDTVWFTAPNQQIYTEGFPTDDSRALLVISSPNLDTAVDGGSQDGVQLRNVEVDGSRDEYGFGSGGLLEFGAVSTGQVIEYVRAYEPRGWSILVLNEGHDHVCREATARNNHFGPGGHAKYVIADGISLACRDSLIEDNLIVDVSDGGIVVFQAPGSIIRNNVIRAENRIMFYGISMVDYSPFEGDFTGTIVEGNTIDAAVALIRYGIPMGPYNGCIPENEMNQISRGAVVRNNTLTGTQMGYGYLVSGVEDWTATGNVDLSTKQPYLPPTYCFDNPVDIPSGFQFYENSTQATLQPEFLNSTFAFATDFWPLDLTANIGCLENLVGADTVTQLRSGTEEDSWILIEEQPNGNKLERCLDEINPPVTSEEAPEVHVAIDICEPRCLSVDLINISFTDPADLSETFFQIDNFRVECEGMPELLPPEETATCTISEFLTPGINVIEWFGLGKYPGRGGWVLDFPVNKF